MSYTAIVLFGKDGHAREDEITFENSWRGAMAVWRYMEQTYLDPYIPYDEDKDLTPEEYERKYGYAPSRLSMFDHKALESLWRTVDDPDIPFNDRVCMATTLDWVLVKKSDFPKVVEAFRAFSAPSSLPEQADEIEKLMEDDTVEAIGWMQNSIVDNLWLSYCDDTSIVPSIDEDPDGVRQPYNYKSGTKHWFLFDEIKKGE